MTKKVNYILGMSLILEALKHRPSCLKEIWLAFKAKDNEFLRELLTLAAYHRIPCFVNQKGIAKISIKENCFAVGVYYPYESVLAPEKFHVLLQDFCDEGNLGTCLRTMVSFNFCDIALIGNNANPFNEKCVRASMGAIFVCHLAYFSDLEIYLKAYKKELYYLSSSIGEEVSVANLKSNCSLLLKANVDNRIISVAKPLFLVGENLSLPVKTALLFHQLYQKI